jgi:hypothetical protein
MKINYEQTRKIVFLTILVMGYNFFASCQEVKPGKTFFVFKDANDSENHFIPSGFMGDCGDIKIDENCTNTPAKGTTCIKVTYTPKGKGPNECGYTPPCKWAGVYWLNPANNWATVPKSGFDLRGYSVLKFFAKTQKPCEIEFKMGGVTGTYGDSQRTALGVKVKLTGIWKEYSISLTGANLSYIIGGFCFATNWSSCPNETVFYLDEIKFER